MKKIRCFKCEKYTKIKKKLKFLTFLMNQYCFRLRVTCVGIVMTEYAKKKIIRKFSA